MHRATRPAVCRVERRAERQRELAVGGHADADDDAGCVGAGVQGQAALPRVEGPPRELHEALGDEDRVALAEVDRAAADLGAHAPAEEEGVHVRALDALRRRFVRVGRIRGPTRVLANRELGAERQRRVTVGLDDHGHAIRDLGVGSAVGGRTCGA